MTKEKERVIDWAEVRRRLEKAALALEQGLQPPQKVQEKILRERARILALETEKSETAGESIEIVEFLLAHERYGIESRYVREVCSLTEITPVPCTPPFVLGIINLRGRIVSVIDIRKFFDLPEQGLTDLNRVILLGSGEMEFGILADAVSGVRNLMSSDLQATLPTLTGIREEYLKGISKGRQVILDGGRLLSDKGIIIEEGVEE